MKFIARLSDEAWGSLKDLVVPKFGPGGVRLGQVVGVAEPPWMKLPQALTRSTPYALRSTPYCRICCIRYTQYDTLYAPRALRSTLYAPRDYLIIAGCIERRAQHYGATAQALTADILAWTSCDLLLPLHYAVRYRLFIR